MAVPHSSAAVPYPSQHHAPLYPPSPIPPTLQVPGAYELPFAARALMRGCAGSENVEAVICIGCLIKGDTMHFEYICEAVTQVSDASGAHASEDLLLEAVCDWAFATHSPQDRGATPPPPPLLPHSTLTGHHESAA